ncbi:DUF1493 family protein [Serratia sp. JUb9]|uniref:DUF1493 family protein n=1 Tax=Serratia rhizosphaerae TaxID=2597702 RepID=A0ABX6GU07_9GAMM|nr:MULTISPECIES: DUF1493 family protein [Serratia]MBU3891167.1 DUF1493 family protein [Serratia rubidaea]AVJ17382.1 cytoplasmic protein [Serratia sp. MYb239]MCA4822198.1 DUF1493 family protein [Serratia rubidaea]MEB6338156.1 DUF1493 family protein [Serratia rhizosphaerae]QHA89760.1 DUF1493 family protein [Serratia rhizosphaerae]
MVTEQEVLDFFRDELSVPLTWTMKMVPLELDTMLQDYAVGDEFFYAIEDYAEKFDVDVSSIDMRYYYPWENLSRWERWTKYQKADVEKTRKPLTVRMFAESAKAGRWLYD